LYILILYSASGIIYEWISTCPFGHVRIPWYSEHPYGGRNLPR